MSGSTAGEWPRVALSGCSGVLPAALDAVCDALPHAIGFFVHSPIRSSLVEVGTSSRGTRDVRRDRPRQGSRCLLAAFNAMDIASVDLRRRSRAPRADYVAFPVSTTYGDGSGVAAHGIWALKVAARLGRSRGSTGTRPAVLGGSAAPPSGTRCRHRSRRRRAFCGTLEGNGLHAGR